MTGADGPQDVDADLDAHLDAVLVGGQRPVLVELVEADPSWPRAFAAHRDRLHAALGAAVSQLEHIGSTSVPGLAAKPVIDVQLVVADVEDEDAYVPSLVAAGYAVRVREPGHRVLTAQPPLSDANVHVYAPEDPELQRTLRLRDRLRADPDARRRYEEVKRSLAGRVWPDANHYARAKSGIVEALLRGE